MKEPYIEGLAPHGGPESCVSVRKGIGEALTGARTGRVSSPENAKHPGAPTRFETAEGNTRSDERACPSAAPRGRRPLACAETPSARTGRSTERPPRWRGGPRREGQGRNPSMHGPWKSDRPVVPAKPPNNAGRPAAEEVEERGLATGNTSTRITYRTQCRSDP